VEPFLAQPGQVPLLIGCDCSVVVGTTQALRRAAPDEVHVLYVDGDFDDAAPEARRCQSAAACAVWLLTHDSPFWGPALRPPQVTVIGWSAPSQTAAARGTPSVSLAEIRAVGPRAAARRALEAVPPSARLVLHLDIDVLRGRDMPAAYFPHADGLDLAEAAEVLAVLAADRRIAVVEVSEYASLRDVDHRSVGALVELLAGALAR
jgi:arginase family enzyme